jgi:hypothetical protein
LAGEFTRQQKVHVKATREKPEAPRPRTWVRATRLKSDIAHAAAYARGARTGLSRQFALNRFDCKVKCQGGLAIVCFDNPPRRPDADQGGRPRQGWLPVDALAVPEEAAGVVDKDAEVRMSVEDRAAINPWPSMA